MAEFSISSSIKSDRDKKLMQWIETINKQAVNKCVVNHLYVPLEAWKKKSKPRPGSINQAIKLKSDASAIIKINKKRKKESHGNQRKKK